MSLGFVSPCFLSRRMVSLDPCKTLTWPAWYVKQSSLIAKLKFNLVTTLTLIQSFPLFHWWIYHFLKNHLMVSRNYLSQSSPQGKAGFKLQKMSKRGSKTSSRLHKCPKPLACSMVWFLPTSNVLARRHLPDLPPWWVPRPYSGHGHLCAPQ